MKIVKFVFIGSFFNIGRLPELYDDGNKRREDIKEISESIKQYPRREETLNRRKYQFSE